MMVSQYTAQAIAAHSALNCPNSLPGNVRFTTMLTDDQKQFFATNGYVLVKGLLSPSEASTYREECHALATRLADIRGIEDPTWGSAGTRGVTQLRHCHDVQFQSAKLAQLLLDDRVTSCAADCIGSPNVQLHHCKMFIKPAEKGSPFPMHQDAPYFPHDNHSMIAAIVHFDAAPIEKGCIRVVPGSNKLGMLPHIGDGGWHLDPDEYSVETATPCPADAGDVLFFSYLTIHGSGINTSDEARTTLLIQMRDPTDPPTMLTHESRGQGMMLRGIDPLCAARPAWEAEPQPGQAMGEPTMGGTMGTM